MNTQEPKDTKDLIISSSQNINQKKPIKVIIRVDHDSDDSSNDDYFSDNSNDDIFEESPDRLWENNHDLIWDVY